MSRRFYRTRKRRRTQPRASLWSASEDRYLQEHYPHTTAKAVSSKLGRTTGEIRARIYKLGLQKQKQEWWTAEEIATLKRLYPRIGARETAGMLRRTVFSVVAKAAMLHLHYDINRWKSHQDAFLRRNYLARGAAFVAAHAGHTRSAVTKRTVALGVSEQGSPPWSAAELATLRAWYPRHGSRATAEKLGRSRASVMLKAQRINVEVEQRFWGPADDAYLRKHYRTRTRLQISRDLGMSDGTVCNHADALGLPSYTPRLLTERERTYMLRHYKTMTYAAIGKRIGRSELSVFSFVQKSGLNKLHIHIWSARDIAYLVRWYGKKPNADIAEHIGVTRAALRNAAYERRLTVPRKRRPGLKVKSNK